MKPVSTVAVILTHTFAFATGLLLLKIFEIRLNGCLLILRYLYALREGVVMRLFVAIDLPEMEKERLSRLCCGLVNARWTDPQQFHLTLRFIGEVEGGLFHDIREALAEINQQPFSLQLEGLGFFPPRGKPKVIWAGLKESEELVSFRNRIESRLVHIGLEPERRKFAPHITLARLSNTPLRQIVCFFEERGENFGFPFVVDSFHLYSSTLTQKRVSHYLETSFLLI